MPATVEITVAVVERHTHIPEKVVFVDGLSGTGKTMMGPILSSFRRTEVHRLDYIYEFTCALRFLNRIEEDAAVLLIRTYTDMACYNAMIGRETNFRWKDLSGVLSNPGGWRYFARLFQPDGDAVLARIARERPILQFSSHQILGIADTLFQALGERIAVVEMVRHPLYLIPHWYSVIDRFGTDPRVFTVWLHHNGAHLPWFAYGWEEKYLASNKMDRVIYTVDWLSRLAQDALSAMDDGTRQQVLVVPFEQFVVDPWPHLHRLEAHLNTGTTRATLRALTKQKIPRRISAAGKDLPIYRRYNWRPPDADSTDTEELEKRWASAAREATTEAMEVLQRMKINYEDTYLKQSEPA